MLDMNLAARFLDALKEHCVVLLVGDANQLPSVGPGKLTINTHLNSDMILILTP